MPRRPIAELIVMSLVTCFLIVFSVVTANAGCLGPTGGGEPQASGCYNISFAPPPPDEVQPDGENPLEIPIGITARNAPPYHWSIEGSGFNLINPPEPNIYEKILVVGPDACGTATITISDNYNGICEAQIRSTSGRWTKVFEDTEGCGVAYWRTAILITGGDKWQETWCYKFWQPPYSADCNNLGWCGRCRVTSTHTSPPPAQDTSQCVIGNTTCVYCWVTSRLHWTWVCP